MNGLIVKRSWLIILALGFVVLAILIVRPVPMPDEKDCLVTKGTVVEIYEAGVHDVVFRLKDQGRRYYVNRGMERGLSLKELRAQLTNKEITIKYPKYWTPLDPGNSIKHISKIEFQGTTIFTEVD